jgi:hypothetical protein
MVDTNAVQDASSLLTNTAIGLVGWSKLGDQDGFWCISNDRRYEITREHDFVYRFSKKDMSGSPCYETTNEPPISAELNTSGGHCMSSGQIVDSVPSPLLSLLPGKAGIFFRLYCSASGPTQK